MMTLILKLDPSQHQDTPATPGIPVKPANSDAALKPPFDSILLVREQRNHVPPVAEQPAPEQDQTHPTEPTRTPPTTTALIRTDEIILTPYDLPGIEPADPDNPPPGKFIVSYTKMLDPPEVRGDKLIVSRTFHVSAHDDSEDAGRVVSRVAKELTPEGGVVCRGLRNYDGNLCFVDRVVNGKGVVAVVKSLYCHQVKVAPITEGPWKGCARLVE